MEGTQILGHPSCNLNYSDLNIFKSWIGLKPYVLRRFPHFYISTCVSNDGSDNLDMWIFKLELPIVEMEWLCPSDIPSAFIIFLHQDRDPDAHALAVRNRSAFEQQHHHLLHCLEKTTVSNRKGGSKQGRNQKREEWKEFGKQKWDWWVKPAFIFTNEICFLSNTLWANLPTLHSTK